MRAAAGGERRRAAASGSAASGVRSSSTWPARTARCPPSPGSRSAISPSVDLKLLVPTVLQASAETLREFPELNARLEGDEIVYLDRYDLGVAVQTDAGPRRPGRPRLRRRRTVDELRAEVDAARREGARGHARPRGAARLDVHRHERGQARRALRRRRSSTTPRSRSSACAGSARGPSCATARSSCGRSGTSRHVRPPRRRRCARRGVRPGGDRAAAVEALHRGGRRHVLVEHRLDPRRARTTRDPRDRFALDDEHERRHVRRRAARRGPARSTSTWITRKRCRSLRAM